MYLDSAKKAELFEKHGKSAKDTGSPESQIALFTFRIAHLTGHLQKNKKDYSTQRALRMIIGKRRRMLDYLQKIDIERYRAIKMIIGKRRRMLDYLMKNDIERYRAIIKELGIRR